MKGVGFVASDSLEGWLRLEWGDGRGGIHAWQAGGEKQV